CQQHNSYPYSF
nr:immunoglobulin light chain junction region [Macaca mulatta]MOV61175.1 immunoglobulin light chain junction region [Macaca mulatta]MOV61275.1 immunoglobulin light chain junction region [Macaca mulatta]MOV61528.1 immunoglobulin light chain junction region [Macaca mulatta]MOV61619.1 immunoglobulin light chain junction region [Macaca mulatta]